MSFQVVIGLEIHVQLRTETKLFCGCLNSFGAPGNANLCPVCLGHPGALPVLNQEALLLARRAALALGAELSPLTGWDRKHYFYPDLPKGYQITQVDRPVATGGCFAGVALQRMHLEEDTGTSKHRDDGTHLDFNRAGVPLLEIVTRPELTTPDETVAFIAGVREVLRYTGVSDADMEKGQLRAEPNVNLILELDGGEVASPVVELKNLNSLASVKAALDCEIERQRKAGVATGEPSGKTTRGYDEIRGVTVLQRGKEEMDDYRYFPEPDLPPVGISPEETERLRADLPELPAARRERMARDYGLSAKRVTELTADRELADFFEGAVAAAGGGFPGETANWVMGELVRARAPDGAFPVDPTALGELVALVGRGEITLDAARRRVWPRMLTRAGTPCEIVAAEGLAQSGDADEIAEAIRRALTMFPAAAEAYLGGKQQALGPVIGAVLRELGGRAEPAEVRELILAAIKPL